MTTSRETQTCLRMPRDPRASLEAVPTKDDVFIHSLLQFFKEFRVGNKWSSEGNQVSKILVQDIKNFFGSSHFSRNNKW